MAHSYHGARKTVPFTPGQAPQFSTVGLVMPIPLPSALVRDFVAAGYRRAEKQTPAEAGAARPVDPGKDRQHFRGPDRRPEARESYPESATILAMPKSKPKRGRGRPAIPGSFVVVKLDQALIERAKKLGDGKIAAGIRAALEKAKAA